jgi:NADH dehydrogenase [ubiquinone] 1 alpha subcomplex assembly factor 1
VILFNFNSEPECNDWNTINDVVMGGVSESRFEYTGASTAVFTGTVSLKNSGGFASVRSAPSLYDLRNNNGLKLRVRGDGKQYKMNLKTDTALDGLQYQAILVTKRNEWTEISIAFTDFVPMFRGGRVNDAPQLDTSSICSFGFLISGNQEGLFRLEIDWIGVYP